LLVLNKLNKLNKLKIHQH